MRIISGNYRGLKLAEFKGEDIRPTADRVKESLFNILMGKITGAKVLDLFCGSGNLGIECLSRGAEGVYFNDLSRDSIAVLKSNLTKMKRGERYQISCLDYLQCLNSVRDKFDLIFIDPPYRYDYGVSALKIISERKLLTPSGIAIYERDRAFEGEVEGLKKIDERKYGKTWLTFFVGDENE